MTATMTVALALMTFFDFYPSMERAFSKPCIFFTEETNRIHSLRRLLA